MSTSYPLFSDSSTIVNLQPEYSFEDRAERIQAQIRTQDGQLREYIFSEFAAFKIPVSYFPDFYRDQVNYWWRNKTNLKFTFSGSTHDVRITNKRVPINMLVKPYDDLYKGAIELEAYQ